VVQPNAYVSSSKPKFFLRANPAVNQVTAQSELAIAREKLETRLDDLVLLRPLPAIALQIMKACREEKVKVVDLVRMVECDVAISSRILSIVNSSLYGYSRDVTSIKQAVVVLGFKSLSQLAVSIAAEKVFSEGESAAESRLRLYDHSLGCAAVARLLANGGHFDVDPGAAFLAGMLHDVGKLVFFDVAPNYYSQMQADCDPGSSVQLEQELFGIDHLAVGAKFGAAWGLPDEITSAIGNHHADITEHSEPILRITSLANELAKTWGMGQSQEPAQSESTLNWLTETGPDAVGQLQAQACEQFGELKSLLSS
jgi:putative nucleotidyltransferase with HDIG domain